MVFLGVKRVITKTSQLSKRTCLSEASSVSRAVTWRRVGKRAPRSVSRALCLRHLLSAIDTLSHPRLPARLPGRYLYYGYFRVAENGVQKVESIAGGHKADKWWDWA